MFAVWLPSGSFLRRQQTRLAVRHYFGFTHELVPDRPFIFRHAHRGLLEPLPAKNKARANCQFVKFHVLTLDALTSPPAAAFLFRQAGPVGLIAP